MTLRRIVNLTNIHFHQRYNPSCSTFNMCERWLLRAVTLLCELIFQSESVNVRGQFEFDLSQSFRDNPDEEILIQNLSYRRFPLRTQRVLN